MCKASDSLIDSFSFFTSLSKEKGIVSRWERYFPLYQMGAGLKGNPLKGGTLKEGWRLKSCSGVLGVA